MKTIVFAVAFATAINATTDDNALAMYKETSPNGINNIARNIRDLFSGMKSLTHHIFKRRFYDIRQAKIKEGVNTFFYNLLKEKQEGKDISDQAPIYSSIAVEEIIDRSNYSLMLKNNNKEATNSLDLQFDESDITYSGATVSNLIESSVLGRLCIFLQNETDQETITKIKEEADQCIAKAQQNTAAEKESLLGNFFRKKFPPALRNSISCKTPQEAIYQILLQEFVLKEPNYIELLYNEIESPLRNLRSSVKYFDPNDNYDYKDNINKLAIALAKQDEVFASQEAKDSPGYKPQYIPGSVVETTPEILDGLAALMSPGGVDAMVKQWLLDLTNMIYTDAQEIKNNNFMQTGKLAASEDALDIIDIDDKYQKANPLKTPPIVTYYLNPKNITKDAMKPTLSDDEEKIGAKIKVAEAEAEASNNKNPIAEDEKEDS